MVLVIIVHVLSAVIVFACVRLAINDEALKQLFEKGNVIVAGRKRKGKDALMAHVIAERKKDHYSNIRYDLKAEGKYKTDIIPLTNCNAGGNSYNDLIKQTVEPFAPILEQKKDIYISDGGIYLPSQEDTALSKVYKGMPITYALSGHLYESNIHVNTQRFNRLWIKLREQADNYILVKSSFYLKKIGLLTRCFLYDKEETASAEIAPFKGRLLSSDRRKVAKEEHASQHGKVSCKWFFIPQRHLDNYDTHELRKTFFKAEFFDDNGVFCP